MGAATLAAIGIALSPLPLLFGIALLGADGMIARTVAFASGEAVAIAVVAVVGILVLERGDDGDVQGLPVLEVAIGVLLAVLLVVHVRRARSTAAPRWQAFLDRIGTGKAFVGGLAMVAVNPKNLALTIAGAAAILQLDYPLGGELAGVLTFTAVSISALLALVVLVAAFPQRAARVLDRVHFFASAHERVLGTVLLAILASFFLLRGLAGVA